MSVPSLPVKQSPSSIVRRSLRRKGFQAWVSVLRTRGLGACSHDACFHPVHPRLADHVLSDAALPIHLHLPRVSGRWGTAGPWVSGCWGQQVLRDPLPVALVGLKDLGGKGAPCCCSRSLASLTLQWSPSLSHMSPSGS